MYFIRVGGSYLDSDVIKPLRKQRDDVMNNTPGTPGYSLLEKFRQ